MPDWRDPEAYAYTETLHVHEWAWEFLRRNLQYREIWKAYQAAESGFDYWRIYRFGIMRPVDPEIQAPDGMPKWIEPIDSILDEIEDYEDLYGDGLPDEKEVFVFDLCKPIEPQLDVARSYLLPAQKSIFNKILPTPRFKRQNFPTYIRLLDAEAAGASIGDMGRLILADREDPRRSAKRMLRTARTMIARDYKRLLLLA